MGTTLCRGYTRPAILVRFVAIQRVRVGGAHAFRVGGACGPPPPVAAPLASSLRAPSRGDPPHGTRSGSGEPAAPRRQSLLRSFLAARSFPRRPPAYGLPP